MIRTQVQLTEEQAAAPRAVAARRGVSMTAVIGFTEAPAFDDDFARRGFTLLP